MKRKILLNAAVLMTILLESSCAFIPTGLYVAGQFSSDFAIRETNRWPCGNIIYGNTVMIRDAWENEDYLLPPWLDRTLNLICLVPAYPVSFVFDLVLWPYELWRHCHLPPEEKSQNGERKQP